MLGKLAICAPSQTFRAQGISALLVGAEYVERLDDWSEAELDPRIKATFHLLEKLTSTPEDVAAPDIARVREAGLSDDAITDAIYVSGHGRHDQPNRQRVGLRLGDRRRPAEARRRAQPHPLPRAGAPAPLSRMGVVKCRPGR